jgi:hypothetical protein
MNLWNKGLCGKAWRRLAACVAAYALVIHAVLTAVAIPVSAMPLDGSPGFVLCLHDSNGAVPTLPVDHPDEHCQLCVGTGHVGFAVLPESTLPSTIAYQSKLKRSAVVYRLNASPVLLSPRPRGPPSPV